MAGEVELSAVLSEFARTMVTDFPIQAILDRFVQRVVEVLPVGAAGVTLISASARPRYVAASNGLALRFEQLQTELGDGPCMAAYRSGRAVSVPDLGVEDRFAGFVDKAREAGLGAVFAFPLRHGEGRLGALDLYREAAGSLDAETVGMAQTLADVASAYLLNAQSRADLFESQAMFRDSALHDALTELPNRTLFLERLEHALLRAGRSGKSLAVLFADLDGFKAVNDLYGHHVGDALLVSLARRLGALIRPGDTLGRLSGDEFVILCEDLDDTLHVPAIAARIEAELARPFAVGGAELTVTASVGVAFSGHDDVPEEVLHRADMAMYRAKRRGGAGHEVYDLRDKDPTKRADELTHDLRGALARGELAVLYQPLVATGTGRVVGGEALLRWAHPNRGTLPPSVFMPLAVRAGLVGEIGRWVLSRALADRATWAAGPGAAALGLSVNVSVPELMSPGFASSVASFLTTSGTDPADVTLEVTERALLQDGQRATMVLEDLRAAGVRIALDDFGAGYASLSHLMHFPLDVVKLDPSLLTDLGAYPPAGSVVEALVHLAGALGLTVVAEGVETPVQHRQLAALGCQAGQGLHFGTPAPADAFGRLMRGSGYASCSCDAEQEPPGADAAVTRR